MPVGAVNVTKVLVHGLELIGGTVCPGNVGAGLVDSVGTGVGEIKGGGVRIGGAVPPIDK